MPTVRCPSCRRPLNLPESVEAHSARCPLCEATFAIADAEVQRTSPALRPMAPLAPVGAREVPLHRDSPSRPAESPRPVENRSLRIASQWLRLMVLTGGIDLLSCGLCNCFKGGDVLSSSGGMVRWFEVLAVLWVIRALALIVVWSAAERLSAQTNLSFTRAGAIVALVYALLNALPTLPLVLRVMEELGRPNRAPLELMAAPLCLSLILTYLTSLCGLIGSILALRQLTRPEVVRAFRRS